MCARYAHIKTTNSCFSDFHKIENNHFFKKKKNIISAHIFRVKNIILWNICLHDYHFDYFFCYKDSTTVENVSAERKPSEQNMKMCPSCTLHIYNSVLCYNKSCFLTVNLKILALLNFVREYFQWQGIMRICIFVYATRYFHYCKHFWIFYYHIYIISLYWKYWESINSYCSHFYHVFTFLLLSAFLSFWNVQSGVQSAQPQLCITLFFKCLRAQSLHLRTLPWFRCPFTASQMFDLHWKHSTVSWLAIVYWLITTIVSSLCGPM